ncbi:Oidioi.mRNA.OKI2018_I69.chr1.g1653.t1.cds [Oikopleura dioica]|uniref:Oidioi.mRNA.OKI2018_I69.chr1.g1653.t1.cds n=1 Tax=Oikopleura dioica TaxID=34765 RepID=A0ABN7SSE4_OIKDI|nr:Oidioi.mRNA.OKI2018_I69.chr1.g1653.t1.cds [Oikopleura dioica]
MARGGQGSKGGGKAQMAQPPITKYRKNIGTYQRDNSNKDATRDFKTKADIRKSTSVTNETKWMGSALVGILCLLFALYGLMFYIFSKPPTVP